MKFLLFLLLIFLLTECSPNSENKVQVYHIIQHPESAEQDTGTIPMPPNTIPVTYYGKYNFILLDTSQIFFHNKHAVRFCGNGIDNTKPPRVFLEPVNVKEIKIDTLQQFLSHSIAASAVNERGIFVSISAPTDTIRNRAIEIIRNHLASIGLNRYNIRNWTEEEKHVLTAIIENYEYHPDSISWETGFDIVFTPPVDSSFK